MNTKLDPDLSMMRAQSEASGGSHADYVKARTNLVPSDAAVEAARRAFEHEREINPDGDIRAGMRAALLAVAPLLVRAETEACAKVARANAAVVTDDGQDGDAYIALKIARSISARLS